MTCTESDRTEFIRAYHSPGRRTVLVCAVLAVAIAAVFIVGITLSQYPMSFSEAFGVLVDHICGRYPSSTEYHDWVVAGYTYSDWLKHSIVVDTNIPRVLGALAVGGTLAVAGAVMQSVVKNPLADPYTTGISSGALLGASLFMALGISVIPFLTGDAAIIANAFLFALIPTAAIASISLVKKNISPTMMILIGIGVMYLFSAASTMLRYSADPDSAHEIFRWTLGSVGGLDWNDAYILMAACIASLVFGVFATKTLNVLSSGDSLSKSLGINVKAFRIICLVVVALFSALMVAFTGTIGFVGLVCPHIARMLVGSNNRHVIPCSMLVGALVLVGSDCIAKIILTAGLPVGTITALIGSPIFIYMLIRQRNSAW